MEKTIPTASEMGKKSAKRFGNMTKEQKSAYFKAIRAGNKGEAKVIHSMTAPLLDDERTS